MTLKAGADLIQEAGMRFQQRSRSRKNTSGAVTRMGPSANNDDLAFTTTANAFLAAEKQTENNTTFGVRIGLFASTRGSFPSQDHWGRTYVFFENDSWGKVELGSKKGASVAMQKDADDITAGSGAFNGNWGKYVSLNSWRRAGNYVTQEMFSGNFADDTRLVMKDSDGRGNNEGSRKITYYTPVYKDFQFGISYVPDEANRGGNTDDNSPFVENGPTRNLKNAIMAGLSYEKQIDKQQKVKASLIGETGQLIRSTQDIIQNRYFVKRATGYDLGGVYTYDKFSVAASYGNRGKFKYHLQPGLRDTVFYTAAVAYQCTDKMRTSLAYFRSDNRNTLDVISLGANYKWMPGLLTYAEVTHFIAHQRFNYATPKSSTENTTDKNGVNSIVKEAGERGRTNVRNRGTVGIIGLRVEL